MKTFSTNFNTEKNVKTGAAPVWILKIPFTAGTVYLSDRVVTYTGITIKAWVQSWGSIDEDLSSELGMPQVSDFTVNLLIDPDEATDIHDLLWTETVETLDCELYLWFDGLTVATDPMVLMWSGNIVDFEKINELIYRVDLADESVKLNKSIGRVLSLADHANADLNDVGYTLPIVYGSVTRVPALGMDVGKITSLPSALTDSATTIAVTDGTGFANGDHIMIDQEEIVIGTVSGNSFTGCTRGYSTTDPAAHSAGTQVLEKQTTFVYMFADHPVKTIDAVYTMVNGVPVDVTSLATVYTGQTGHELAGYTGKAVVTLPGYVTYAKAVSVGLVDTIAVSDTIGVSDTISVSDTIGVSDGISVSDTIGVNDGILVNDNIGYTSNTSVNQSETYPWSGGPWAVNQTSTSGTATYPSISNNGTDKYWEVVWGGYCSTPQANSAVVTININVSGTNVTVAQITNNGYMQLAGSPLLVNKTGSWPGGSITPITRTGTINGSVFAVQITNILSRQQWAIDTNLSKTGKANRTGNVNKTGAASKSGTVSKTGSASKAGAASKSGTVTKTGTVTASSSSYSDVAVGTDIYITGTGYQDDGSGTFTGSASSLISRPDHIFKHFLYTYASWPVADFSTDAATPFAADSYAFGMVINERKKLNDWLAYMALQCRCWFRFSSGKAYLLYRTDTLSSDKTITAAMIGMNTDYTTTTRLRRSPLDEVINYIDLYYNKDWSLTGDDAYRAISSTSDATSIAAYGQKDRPDLFKFDFITSATMAADVRDFYLARYKDRKKVVGINLFLDNAELEFADAITITPLGALVCEVRNVSVFPGSKDSIDTITLTGREY